MINIAQTKLSDEEINAAVEVLKSGNLREGKKCEEFENNFCKLTGAKYATTYANGTAALHACYLNTINKGDEVLVPSLTFFATASMVDWAGGTPVFCDIDPNTFTLDIKDAEKRITNKTKAIAPVHLFGNSCEIDEIIALANKYNLKIIWDAAQAHLTKYKGTDVASFADAVCYSFYATKNMTTGEGGMITSPDKDFIEKCILIKHQGQSKKYYHTAMGTNYRITDIQAAIGIEQLKKIRAYTDKRRENAKKLIDGLSSIKSIQLPFTKPYVEHSYHQFTILVDDKLAGINRDELAKKMSEKGIATGINYPIPLHKQPAFDAICKKVQLETAERVCNTCLSLPVHPFLSNENVETIVKTVKDIFG